MLAFFICIFIFVIVCNAQPDIKIYDCGSNSPCTSHPNRGHYFRYTDPSKYIKCGWPGQCYILQCAGGLIWDQYISACNNASAFSYPTVTPNAEPTAGPTVASSRQKVATSGPPAPTPVKSP